MTNLTLTNIPPSLLQEWKDYAVQTGLPLDYLVLEAVTYSIRSDRLGVEAAKIACAQRKRSLLNAKKNVDKYDSSKLDTSLTGSPVLCENEKQSISDGNIVSNLAPEYMDSDESSAGLEDFVPRNL